MGLTWAVFRRARDERGGQAGIAGGCQIGVVRGGEHDLAGAEIEDVGSPGVRLGLGFVGTGDVGADDDVPRQAGPFGHVCQQRKVGVGQRSDQVTGPQVRQAGDAVGPWV